MKQLMCGKGIFVSDVPSPGLGSGQVLVEVAYSFISTGTELGGVKSAGGGVIAKIKEHPQRVAQVLEMVRINGVKKTMARVKSKLESRKVLGYSCAGRVVATGRDVRNLAVGDLVACAGMGYASHAEVVSVPVNLVAQLPPGCDPRQASGTTVAAIALQSVRRADLRLGEIGVVLGLGLLGQIALQLLRASGVKVLGFDANPQRVAEAKALGFSDCFALTGEYAVNEVLAHTAQMGADAVLLTAATDVSGICQDALEMCRRKGRVVVVGAVPLEFERDPFYKNEIDFLISCSYGPGRYDPTYEEEGHDYPYSYVRWTENRNMQAVLQMIADGTLRLDHLISAEYPIDEADQAFAALSVADGPRPLGVVLKYELAETPSPAKLAKSIKMSSPAPLKGKIGLGVVGLGGFFTGTHLPNLAALSGRYQIVATCDHASSKAQDLARQYGATQSGSDYEEMLQCPDVQVVLIATRHDTHALMSSAAIQASKHVFTEKPMAMNQAELDELKTVLEGSDRYLMVGFNRRFSPHAVRLRELLANRAGPVVINQRILADAAPPSSWIYSAAGGGRVIGEACHMLDLFNFLVGEEMPLIELDVSAPPVGVGGPPGDNFVATLRYEDGSVCTLTYTALGRKSKQNGKERLEAMWDGKTFVIDDYLRSYGSGCAAGSAGSSSSKGHYEELVVLANYLNGKGPVPISVEASLRATEQSFRIDAACRNPTPPTEEAKA
ncbi:MAG: Gfo/Idh/MocA family oxidoreductase [Phycisphaerae bacterium]|nr:Gfo/Idh/MocA family oxidoreductase [Phycisphaerae bacterium]